MIIITITVIDSIMGSGKTSWIIQEINKHPDKSYIYCTPLLSEIQRIKCSCGNGSRFSEPLAYDETKIDNFNTLLSNGDDIAVTHSTFLNATNETLQLISEGDYTLIIDEALDVVTNFNHVQSVVSNNRQSMTQDDVNNIIKEGLIRVDDMNKVHWCGGNYGKNSKFYEVRRFANLGRLFCIDGSFLLTTFPPEIFNACSEVIILTYLFEGSIFKYYFDYFDIGYTKKSVIVNDGIYSLEEFDTSFDYSERKKYDGLIDIYENKTIHAYDKHNVLSSSWCQQRTKEDMEHIKKSIRNFFRNYCKGASAKREEIMWTCYSTYEDVLSGEGYTRRNLTDDEKTLTGKEKEEAEKKAKCFVPCNARATNDYSSRWALAYCINLFMNPQIKKFFTSGNEHRKKCGKKPIEINEELYSLSSMLQWIWRSRIRNGQDVKIYIPSKRMRDLLKSWLKCEI